ncbi:SPOR domain-containing protein [Hydrogenophaga sp.]|uniref:SPOR domain-containing protein n=1 Tax=Hydrogenophaga sp. TaxID=1904254 RepID=UPI00271DF014|nr:SPOR domain-containing protein [Hydrogenophaga sp.]MDO9438968.1 SPOR domain-containing protein [Hydrogenophaga sp.]
MLRWVIVLLVLANAGYFAWTQGYLDGMGMAPVDQREPERLAQQVKPDALRLLNGPPQTATPVPEAPMAPPATDVATAPRTAAGETRLPVPSAPPSGAPTATTAPPPAPAATATVAANEDAPRACWQAGSFTEPQAELLRAELALLGMQAGQWQFTEQRSGARWIVYMGRYDNAAQLDRKKAELRGIGVSFRDISAPGLGPGLALGTYSTEAAAQQALRDAEQGGVRTAKVAQERAESVALSLRLPAITEAQRAAVDRLDKSMAGKTLRRCS